MTDHDPKYQRKLEDLGRRMADQPGALDLALRRIITDGGEPPEALADYVNKVRRHAYKVSLADVAGLLAAGYTEDQVFELTVAAAYGAARRRLDAGLAAMSAFPEASGAEPAEADR